MRKANLMSDELKFNLEEMSEFFNKRAKTYDQHMSEVVEKFEDYYDSLSSPMGEGKNKIKVLDIGCGTGLELEGIFKRNPEAEIDVIDMSEEMLTILKEKYKDKLNQIKIIQGSYLTIPFNQNYYDYVIASMTIHHFTAEEKARLYKKINSALINGGKYIEGDYYMASKEEEEKCLDFYYDAINKIPKDQKHLYHIDIPFTLETENELLKVGGFTNIYKKLQFGEKCILVGEKIENITYRKLRISDCDKIKDIDASQYIGKAWREVDGKRKLIEINYQDETWPNGYEWHYNNLRNTIISGGSAIGCFDENNKIVGFGTINNVLFGEKIKYVLLDQLFISLGNRAEGIGRKLFMELVNEAKKLNADKIYICAGSAEETIAFYFSIGCIEAEEINQELYESDKRDFQLEFSL